MSTFEFHVTYNRDRWECDRVHLSTCPKRSKDPIKIFTSDGPDPLTAFEIYERTVDVRFSRIVGAMCCVDKHRETRPL